MIKNPDTWSILFYFFSLNGQKKLVYSKKKEEYLFIKNKLKKHLKRYKMKKVTKICNFLEKKFGKNFIKY